MPLPATLTNVSLDAPSGHVILSDVSLEVRAGELTVVAGPSGAGKTSLLELVCGLRKPAAGTVELFGEPLRRPEKLPPRARRRIAYLFQAPERLFFRATLREEFDAALTDRGIAPSDIPARAEAALRAVDLPGHPLDRSPIELSGGEQRLAALALVQALDPGLLVLDEPTAGLDRDHALAVVRSLANLRDGGAAIVLATHDLDRFAPVADHLVCIANGRVVAQGAPSAVLERAPELVRSGVALPFAVRAAHALGLPGDPPMAIDHLADRIAAAGPLDEPVELPRPPAPVRAPTAPRTAATRLPPLTLIPSIVASLAMGLAFLVPAPLPLLAAYAVALVALAAGWGISPSVLGRRLLPVFVLAAMAASLHLIAPGGDWGRFGELPGRDAYFAAARTVLRVVGPVLAAAVFCATVHPALLLRDFGALVRSIPGVRSRAADLSLALALVLRTAPGFAATAKTFQRSRLARGVPPGRGPADRLRTIVAMAVPLLLVTVRRSADLAAALYLRGFGDPRAPQGALRVGAAGWIFSGAALLALLAAIGFAKLLLVDEISARVSELL